MGEMRNRMEEELKLRGYSPKTIKVYTQAVHNFVRFHKRQAQEMGVAEARAYLLHLNGEKKLSVSTVNQAVCALRFFYVKVLRRTFDLDELPYQKRKRSLPCTLSEKEVAALLEAELNVKPRAILMTLYSGGLRLQEVIQLRPKDIDSMGMRIHIRAGKGGKARYVMLSATLLDTLRDYFKLYKPGKWLFYGQTPDQPINSRSVQRMIQTAASIWRGNRQGVARSPCQGLNPHRTASDSPAASFNLRLSEILPGPVEDSGTISWGGSRIDA